MRTTAGLLIVACHTQLNLGDLLSTAACLYAGYKLQARIFVNWGICLRTYTWRESASPVPFLFCLKGAGIPCSLFFCFLPRYTVRMYYVVLYLVTVHHAIYLLRHILRSLSHSRGVYFPLGDYVGYAA